MSLCVTFRHCNENNIYTCGSPCIIYNFVKVGFVQKCSKMTCTLKIPMNGHYVKWTRILDENRGST